jgi:hypothetical protein
MIPNDLLLLNLSMLPCLRMLGLLSRKNRIEDVGALVEQVDQLLQSIEIHG